MASAVACRGPALANLKKLFAEPSATGAPVAYYALSPAAVTASRRLYNTQGKEVRRYDDDDDPSGEIGREYEDADAGAAAVLATPTYPASSPTVCVLGFPASVLCVRSCEYCGTNRSTFFCVHNSSDLFDRFGAPTSLGRLLGLMEDVAAASGPSGLSSTAWRGWPVAKEDDEAVYLKVPMPGLGKEHVKVSAEQNSLVIKGEGEKEPWDGDKDDAAVQKYSGRIEIPANAFKMDKIKAEKKNGVLRVTVPKLKKEERKDVFQIAIE
ncbi:hypothetical protein ACQ4PT_041247 [Festuca glaucescens]